MRKHETAVCGTARTVVWEIGKCENRRQMPFMISIYLLPDLSHAARYSERSSDSGQYADGYLKNCFPSVRFHFF